MPDTEMLELLKQRLQRKQYKLTMQRRTVLEILLEHPGEHLSAEDVYGALRDKSSDVGLATVYRTLELLVQLGFCSAWSSVTAAAAMRLPILRRMSISIIILSVLNAER